MQLNGKTITAAPALTLAQLLKQRGFDGSRVAVELNGSIVSRNDFGKVQLQDSDTLEVVQFVGGG
ncbi:sulfur carrier protein ThiS [uncultured Phascolarctobacterium sp.]|uniref:sulfur carrier protein ThiS n=1 Tax=uncultured Phascolarctobacterium sp. TaxID=512296 RepID=UPI0027D96524|nr:sulfur carrier protein ThiS [uncultured Phascolarctobacterium sp.]